MSWLRRNNFGFGLAETVMALGLGTVAIAGFTSLMTMMVKQQSKSNLTFQADNVRRSLVSAINSTKSWTKTVADVRNNKDNGPHLDCLGTSNPCTLDEITDLPSGTPVSNKLINKIIDVTGNVLLDSTQPNLGFTPA